MSYSYEFSLLLTVFSCQSLNLCRRWEIEFANDCWWSLEAGHLQSTAFCHFKVEFASRQHSNRRSRRSDPHLPTSESDAANRLRSYTPERASTEFEQSFPCTPTK